MRCMQAALSSRKGSSKMKTTWFTVATGSEQFVKMACLLGKNWQKHNKSELVIVTDSDIPEKMGLPNLKSNQWQNRRDWGWHFKFEAYDKIWKYNNSDIFCLLDSDVMPVKPVDEKHIKTLSFSGCHIAMEEDMIGDGVGEWWSFKNPHLSGYMLEQIRKNHRKASQAWHGNGGFHFWHRDLLKRGRFINRANQIFSDLAELSKRTGSGFPCEEPVQQTMVQELTSPQRVHEHSLEQGPTKYIQETVFWSDVPSSPVVMNKSSYFTGKRKWTCEPSNIHLISAKNKLTEMASNMFDNHERGLRENASMHIENEDIYNMSEWCYQNISGDSLVSIKMKITIAKDHREHIDIDKNTFKKYLDHCHIENMDFKSSSEENNALKLKSSPVVMSYICNKDEIKHGISKSIKYVKNGGIFAICIKDGESLMPHVQKILGNPHQEIGTSIKLYMIDPVRRMSKKI